MGRLLPEVQMGVCQFQVDNNNVNHYTNFDVQCQNPLCKYPPKRVLLLTNCGGINGAQFNEYAHSFPTAKPVFTSSENSAVAETHSQLLTSDGMTDPHTPVQFTHCTLHFLSAERHKVEYLVIFRTWHFHYPDFLYFNQNCSVERYLKSAV
jgi:hypothetical protein